MGEPGRQPTPRRLPIEVDTSAGHRWVVGWGRAPALPAAPYCGAPAAAVAGKLIFFDFL